VVPSVSPAATILNFFDSFLKKIIPSVMKPKKLVFCESKGGDLNCDGYVDLIDISILFYWWDKSIDKPQLASLVGSKFKNPDLSGDGYVDIRDASILLKYWTG
jgi:hypothetical protein